MAMAEEEGACPIQSNIESTAGQEGTDIDMNSIEDDNAAFEEEEEFDNGDNALFEQDDGDAILDDDDWGDLDVVDDGQKIIPIEMPEKPVIGVDDENPYGEGNEVEVRNGGRPQIRADDPKQKCWICDVCNAINNLLDSAKKYNFRCCICSYAYHPNVAIIFSNDWDGVNEENENEQIYTVWNCPFCTLRNDIAWQKCDGCECAKPPDGQVAISYSYVRPKKLNGKDNKHQHNNNNNNFVVGNNYNNFAVNHNQNQKKKQNNNNKQVQNYNKPVRKPRLGNIGVARDHDSYPAKSVLDSEIEARLRTVFGNPHRNQLLCKEKKNTWTLDCNLSHSRVEWASYSKDAQKFVTEELVGRGFAVNQRTGWIATMSINYIWVFEPYGCMGYKLKARYEFTEEQKLKGEDVQNSRIRYINNSIFVWSFARSRVYSFKVSFNSIILVDVIRDKYFKDSQTMDVAITDDLLILLFDRWCGVYKLYPKFEWYHAVAFATNSVNCFSLEISSFDDEQDALPMSEEAFFRDDEEEKSSASSKSRSRRKKKKKQQSMQQDESKENDKLYRPTNQNYMFINAESQLIGIHPSNPTFDFLHIAKDAQHGKCKFCVSKRYGAFYLSNDGTEIYQSSHLEYQSAQKLVSLNSAEHAAEKFFPVEQFHDLVLRQGIKKFVNLQFDETFGVSGRLLLFCQTKKSEYIIHQVFNHEELSAFSEELSQNEYYLIPGSTRKPFNLTIYVYEFLFGQDLIDTLLQSPYFNPSLLRVKQQQQKELQQIEEQQKEPEQPKIQEQDFLFVNVQNDGNLNEVANEDDDDSGVDMEVEQYPQEGEGM